jgi:hypothetical protein
LANLAIPLTLSVPALGDVWQGGWYAGTFDPIAGTTTHTHHLVSSAGGDNVNGVENIPWTSAIVSSVPSDNSLYDGLNNTVNLYNFAYTNTLYNLQAIRYAQDHVNFITAQIPVQYSDWYLPAQNELFLLQTRIGSLYGQRGVGSPNINANWSSTVKDSGRIVLNGNPPFTITYTSARTNVTQAWARPCRRVPL